MAVKTAEEPKSALTEDFIGFEDVSSSEDEETVGGEENTKDTGTKRGHSDDDGDDHSGTYQKCYNGQNVPPWLTGQRRLGTGKLPDISTMINEEVTKFVAYISPTPEEHQMRAWVIERMQKILGSWELPDARPVAQCFGSFETRLYLPTSDIDMTIMLYDKHSDQVAPAYSGRESVRAFLYKLARQLKQNDFCITCEVIANARVPIIKTHEKISGIAVDISINADSGMKSAQVQRSFAESVYPTALRSIVLAIKQFLYQRSMNEVYTGGMGSYAITLLVVSMLQMHPRIRSGGLDATKNLGVLLIEFFELYGKRFNYDNVCVSVLESGQYLDKRRKAFYNHGQPYLLSIEDPCDTSNDVTKGTYGINRIKQTFSGAYDLFNNAIFAYHQTRKHGQPINAALAGGADSKRSSSEQPKRKRARGKGGKAQEPSAAAISNDPWAPVSFLSSILHVGPKTIAIRKKLVATFYDGAMQKVLGVQYQPQLVKALNGTLGGAVQPAAVAAVEAHANGGSAQEQINSMKFDFASHSNEPVFVSDDDDDDDDYEDGLLDDDDDDDDLLIVN